jgi:hypothetical protein
MKIAMTRTNAQKIPAAHIGQRRRSVEVLNSKGLNLIRFVTTTQGWSDLVRNEVCVPDEWPYMVVELLVGEDGSILMSTTVGIPKASVSAFQYQGLYCYEFGELPETIVTAVIAHFKNIYKELLRCVDTLIPEAPKPRLLLVKK